ncbi:MAG: hypothetical protein FJ218_01815 [Ignavibacteria bacterium]|nr:hypothetical protein [Ignavibacteria bacterium]
MAEKEIYQKARIIFLDIDGVLCPYRKDGYVYANALNIPFDKNAVANLNELTEITDAKIVITSARRVFWDFEELKNLLKKNGVRGEIIDKTPMLGNGDLTDVKQFTSPYNRGKEIEQWIRTTSYDIINFLIIDDQLNGIDKIFPKKFLHLNAFEGLRNLGDVMTGLSILSGKYEHKYKKVF